MRTRRATATPPRINAAEAAKHPRRSALRLYRDPRDRRELLTDVLGLTVDASMDEVQEGRDTATSASNLLGRRKRERAWQELQDPVNRMLEEALLYPIEPMPEPDDANFPAYGPRLPALPVLHEPARALERLLEAVAESLPEPRAVPEPELRLDHAPRQPDLPPPRFRRA